MADRNAVPKCLDEAAELADLLRPSWGPMSRDLRASGVPLNEGESGDEGGDKGAEGKEAERPEPAEPEIDEAILAGAEKPDAVRNAIKAERERAAEAERRAKEAEGKVREFEDRDKSEQEKAEQRASEAEQKANEATTKLLRLEVAGAKKLPLELAERLRGDTKEALEKDADALLKLVKEGEADGGRTSFEAGAAGRTSTNANDPDALIRQMAR
jgi:beta-glucosidase-like glycosyl hydrolase